MHAVGDSLDVESEVSSATSHGSFMSVVRAAKLAADQVSTPQGFCGQASRSALSLIQLFFVCAPICAHVG